MPLASPGVSALTKSFDSASTKSFDERLGQRQSMITLLERGQNPEDKWIEEKLATPEGRSGNDMHLNMAIGAKIVKERQAEQREKDPFSWSTINMKPPGLGGPMEGFFNALIGKEAVHGAAGQRMRTDITGIGRLKGQDVATGRVFDVAEEGIPQSYSNTEQDYIMRSNPAINALRRAAGRPGVVL